MSKNYADTWRPKRLDELVGQETTSRILTESLKQDRISGAYLFGGTRGTGKTSTARILARSMLCETAEQTARPCGICKSCESADRDMNPNMMEIDAASNRTGDDMTRLRTAINQQAGLSQRRVAIVDETHMLTKPALETLRGMLEDNDGETVFILCTTEPEKLPPEVANKCQQHRFRKFTHQEVRERLAEVCRTEQIECENAALRLISHAADGSMRDALKSLETMESAGGGVITAPIVEAQMGRLYRQEILVLTRQLLEGATEKAIATIREAGWKGMDRREIHGRTAEMLNAALLLAWDAADTLDLPETTEAALAGYEWQRIIAVIELWNAHRPDSEDQTATRLELAAQTSGEGL